MEQHSYHRKQKNLSKSSLKIPVDGAEVWTMTTTIRNKISTVEWDFVRRKDRIRTEEVWERMELECSITK